MPLYLFVVSSWPMFLVYLRCKLPVERVEGTLAMGAAARKRRFIGQRALPQERQLFCRKFLLYASPQNHLPLFALGHTHTYMHSLAVKPKQEREAGRLQCPPHSRGWRTTQWRTLMTSPVWEQNSFPRCPGPTSVPALMLEEEFIGWKA